MTPPQITPAQARVYELLVLGYTAPEIAPRLGLAVKTVENHRYAILHRLGKATVPKLVAWHYAEWLPVQRGSK